MEKVYKRRNGTIYVTIPETCDREKLRSLTEDFLKKVIIGGKSNGDSNSSGDFRKE